MVNGCLIEYKWFQPHFIANLFHLPLSSSTESWMESNNNKKKVILHHHHHDTDNYWERVFKAIDTEHLLESTASLHVPTHKHNQQMIYIRKYRSVKGNWFEYIQGVFTSMGSIMSSTNLPVARIWNRIYMTNVCVINCILYQNDT